MLTVKQQWMKYQSMLFNCPFGDTNRKCLVSARLCCQYSNNAYMRKYMLIIFPCIISFYAIIIQGPDMLNNQQIDEILKTATTQSSMYCTCIMSCMFTALCTSLAFTITIKSGNDSLGSFHILLRLKLQVITTAEQQTAVFFFNHLQC